MHAEKPILAMQFLLENNGIECAAEFKNFLINVKAKQEHVHDAI